MKTDTPEIEIEKTGEPIKVPRSALDLLGEILKVLSEGRPVSVFPVPTEMTTQAAADHLNVSRPYLVKLLEEGRISFTKVGRHHRIKVENLMTYEHAMKAKQKRLLTEMMQADEADGLYVE